MLVIIGFNELYYARIKHKILILLYGGYTYERFQTYITSDS